MSSFVRVLVLPALLFLSLSDRARADAALPANILDPKSEAEAWNVIRLATANVEELLKEKRLPEIPVQISLCSPSLRTLAQLASPAKRETRQKQQEGTVALISSVVRACQTKEGTAAESAFVKLRAVLDEMARDYDSKLVRGEIYICPMHPEFVATEATALCDKCGMNLVLRRIPASFIYVPPGEPSLRLEVAAPSKLKTGRAIAATIQLHKRDGTPVSLPDLMVMHTQAIHLLIVDRSLRDYHHEHPKPTGRPGEYAFSFTPTLPGPYRVWADVVPAATGVQEYVFADLPSTEGGGGVVVEPDKFSTSAGGLNFKMTFDGDKPPRAQQVALMKVRVNESDGRAVTRLEPLMNAFAHVVGFYDDYSTIVHLHPAGGEVLRSDLRGGPEMVFKFFPPKPGFMRLYCQVQVEGKIIFAPFNLNVKR